MSYWVAFLLAVFSTMVFGEFLRALEHNRKGDEG